MTMKIPKGFTLIELLIVVAMISILATMALPSMQDRVMRTQVQEGIQLTEFVRQAVGDYYREKGQLPQDNLAAARKCKRLATLVGEDDAAPVAFFQILHQLAPRAGAAARGEYPQRVGE